MKLMKLFTRRASVAPAAEAALAEFANPQAPAQHSGTVVPFPSSAAPQAGSQSDTSGMTPVEEEFSFQANSLRQQVLFDLPEIRGFLDHDHLRRGRQLGAHIGDAMARAQGREELIAEFQTCLQALVERKQAKEDKLEQLGLQMRGLHASLGDEVASARAHLRRDIERLRGQIDSAGRGEGWVARALAQFDLGFMQGVRARIGFCTHQ